MNKLNDLVSKENGIYILSAIAHAVNESGKFSVDVKTLSNIIKTYSSSFIDFKTKKPRTPHETLKYQLTVKGIGKKYFQYDKDEKIVSLLDCCDLESLKKTVWLRLAKLKAKKFKKPYIPKSPKSTDSAAHLKDLENDYPYIDLFIKTKLEPAVARTKYLVVYAAVKSGKKIIKMLLAIRGQACGTTHYVVVSSLNRKDCKSQMEEYSELEIKYFPFFTKEKKIKALENINSLLENGDSVVVLHDESDYGTGNLQLMSYLYKTYANNDKVKFIGFSATNEEFGMSDLPSFDIVTFVPPKNYCGAKWFLHESLTVEAEQILDENSPDFLSDQGREIFEGWKSSNKDFVVIRFASGFPAWIKDIGKLQRKINTFFDNKLTGIQIINENNGWDWGKHGNWRQFISTDSVQEKQLLLICQTATRSVEWDKSFLQKLYAVHDFRSDHSSYNTIIQAILRAAHYKTNDSDQNIRPYLYCTVKAIELAARLEDCEDFDLRRRWCNAYDGKLSSRIHTSSSNYNYTAMRFNEKPTRDIIEKECKRRNITPISQSFDPKYRYIKTANSDDLADAALHGIVRSSNSFGGIIVYSLNGPNPKYIDSWNKLIQSGYTHGEFVAIVPTGYKQSASTSDKSVFQNLTCN